MTRKIPYWKVTLWYTLNDTGASEGIYFSCYAWTPAGAVVQATAKWRRGNEPLQKEIRDSLYMVEVERAS